MIRISSRGTWFQKRVFPLIWFGALAAFTLFALVGQRSGPWPIFVIMPVAMAVAGFLFMKKLIWPLMDEVYDAGDHLVVIKRSDEERILLSDVINISASPGRPPLVTLRLRHAGRFGNEIAFVPQSSFHFNPFARNPIVEELITRVDRARSAARHA
jgi:hypothetical protein